MYNYCYWTFADNKYATMMETVIKSARMQNINTDFHVWSNKTVDGAMTHEIPEKVDKSHYLFKLHFLKDHVYNLNYDYFIFLDSDSYFVKNDQDILSCLHDDPLHICLENDCCDQKNGRKEWWNCPLDIYIQYMRNKGVRSNSIYNTNAGFWIVHRDIIPTMYDLAMNFWYYCKDNGHTFTEEPPLAYVGHMLTGNPYTHTLTNNKNIWASDWTGIYNDRLPDGKKWEFENYLNGDKITVDPIIVHCMRSKKALLGEV